MTPPVAYPGPPGSHTPLPRRRSSRRTSSCRSPASAPSPTRSWPPTSAHGVLPIESSLAGAVAETHDLLYERALSIVGETSYRSATASPALGGPCPSRRSAIVRSHPIGARAVSRPARPAAEGVGRSRRRRRPRRASRSPRTGDPTVAAIVGDEAVDAVRADGARRRRRRQPGVHALRLDRAVHARRPRLRDARTAFTFATNHKPGALFAAIEPFARAGLDLVRLVSRPLPATPWKYRFDAVVVGPSARAVRARRAARSSKR